MKTAIATTIIAVLLFSTAGLDAQELDPMHYFPVGVGDVWEYATDIGFVRYVVSIDSLAGDGAKYVFYAGFTDPQFRVDTSRIVHYLPLTLNLALYKLDADSGDTWMVQPEKITSPGAHYRTQAKVNQVYQSLIFGGLHSIKEIAYYRLPWGDTTITPSATCDKITFLASGIGKYYEYDPESGPMMQLQGCIIDGDTMGSISTTQVVALNEAPTGYQLFQNYPNPFNHGTHIRFHIPVGGKVVLQVYSILGKKIAVLIDKYLMKGDHDVSFSPSYDLASGLYLYALNVGGKVMSGRMVYLK